MTYGLCLRGQAAEVARGRWTRSGWEAAWGTPEGEQDKCETKSTVDLNARGSWAKPRGTPVMAVPRFGSGRRSSSLLNSRRSALCKAERPAYALQPTAFRNQDGHGSLRACISTPYIDLRAEPRLSRNTNIAETQSLLPTARAYITGRLLRLQEVPTSLPARAPSTPASPVLELNRVEHSTYLN